MKKYLVMLLSLFLFALSGTWLKADEDYESDLLQRNNLLFVSVGSFCEPNHMLRYCDLRKEAFPFDWIVSFDGEGVIELLENDFKDLFNRDNFFTFGPGGHLIETHYHFEFLHDGNFNDNFDAQFEEMQQKYLRRIIRFKSLNDYKGKIVFLRNANTFSMTDPHRYYRFEANLEITEEYAVRLYRALKVVFPTLDFDLAIVNCGDVQGVVEEKHLGEHITMCRANPHVENPQKTENYRRFFQTIIDKNQR